MKFSTSATILLVSLGSSLILCSETPLERSEFRQNPAIQFDLWPANIELLGGRFYMGSKKGRLPYWFDFTLYKNLYKKNYTQPDDDLRHHIKYMENCAEILRRRVLFRILGDSHDHYVDSGSDKVSLCP